jgi:hypothetical protein
MQYSFFSRRIVWPRYEEQQGKEEKERNSGETFWSREIKI